MTSMQELLRYAESRGGKIHKVLSEFKRGELHSGSKTGPEVTNRKQAVAIALSEARKEGENVPAKHSYKKPHELAKSYYEACHRG